MTGNHLEEVFETLAQKSLPKRDKDMIWANLEKRFGSTVASRGFLQRSRFRPATFASLGAAMVVLVASGILVRQTMQFAPNFDTAQTNQLAKRSDLSVQFQPPPAMWLGFRVEPEVKEPPQPETYEVSRSMAMPLNPQFQSVLLKKPNVKIFSPEKSRQIAGFPIHEPESVKGWTRTFSKGVEFPVRHIEHGKFTGIRYYGLNYYDIYEASGGRKIAVTQRLERGMTLNLQWYLKGDWQDSLALFTYPVGTKGVAGFGNDLALLYADHTDDMKELTVYHVEGNQVLSITVNGTNAQDLVKFAHIYLEASSK
jgi:hypothetical protein